MGADGGGEPYTTNKTDISTPHKITTLPAKLYYMILEKSEEKTAPECGLGRQWKYTAHTHLYTCVRVCVCACVCVASSIGARVRICENVCGWAYTRVCMAVVFGGPQIYLITIAASCIYNLKPKGRTEHFTAVTSL